MARMTPVVDETFYGYPGRRYVGHNRVLPNARGAGAWPGYRATRRPQPLKKGLKGLFGLAGGPKPIPSGTYLGAPGAQLSSLRGDPQAGTAWRTQRGPYVLNGLEGLGGKGARICTVLAELTGLTLNQIKDMRTAELEATLEANKEKSAELKAEVDAYGGAAIAASIIKGICAAAAEADSGSGDGPDAAPDAPSYWDDELARRERAEAKRQRELAEFRATARRRRFAIMFAVGAGLGFVGGHYYWNK